MASIEQSSVWRHLSLALRQIAPLADGRPHGPEERRRATEALEVIGRAIKSLMDQKVLSPPEMRLLESEANRIRTRLATDEGAVRPHAGALRPSANPQASYDRLNKLLPVLRQVAETGMCSKPVLDCVRKGLELDLAVLRDERNLMQIIEPLRPKVEPLTREVKRRLETLSVIQEIQAASS